MQHLHILELLGICQAWGGVLRWRRKGFKKLKNTLWAFNSDIFHFSKFSYYQATQRQPHDIKWSIWILLKVQHAYTRVHKTRPLYKHQELLWDTNTSQSLELQGQMTIKLHHKLQNTSTMHTQAMILSYKSSIIFHIISTLLTPSQTSPDAYKPPSASNVQPPTKEIFIWHQTWHISLVSFFHDL